MPVSPFESASLDRPGPSPRWRSHTPSPSPGPSLSLQRAAPASCRPHARRTQWPARGEGSPPNDGGIGCGGRLGTGRRCSAAVFVAAAGGYPGLVERRRRPPRSQPRPLPSRPPRAGRRPTATPGGTYTPNRGASRRRRAFRRLGNGPAPPPGGPPGAAVVAPILVGPRRPRSRSQCRKWSSTASASTWSASSRSCC